jgi:uncharacterized membrane protein YdjX (TVP38/TMEM64 family)
MLRPKTLHIIQAAIGVLWLCVILFCVKWIAFSGIPLRHVPQLARSIIHAYGMYGPLVILGLYALRGAFFVIPTAMLNVLAGSLYGPVWGSLLNLTGEMLTTNISFGLGRLFGRRIFRAHEHGWVKRYDDVLKHEGFLTVLIMRSLYFPFDLVNYGSGISSMMYRQYVLGTFLGLLAPVITLTVLGNALTNPRALVAFVILSVFSIGSAFLLRRSEWAKRRLYPPHVHETI